MKQTLYLLLILVGLIGCDSSTPTLPTPTNTPIIETDVATIPPATATPTPTSIPTETPIPATPTPSLPADLTELSAHDFRINAIAINNDSTQFATASNDDTIKLWLMDGTLVQTFTGHEDNVKAVVFSPDQTKLISGGDDGRVIIWDIETGEALHNLDSESFDIHSLAVSPTFFVSGSDNPHVWDYEGDLLGVLEGVHRSNRVRIKISPQEDMIVSYGQDDNIALWQISGEGVTLIKELSDQTESVYEVYFLSQQDVFFTSEFRSTIVKFWGVDGELLEESDLGLFYLLDMSSDGSSLYFAGGGSILVQNSTYLTDYLEIADGMSPVLIAKFSENGRLAFAGNATQTAVGNTLTGETITLPGQEQGTELFSISPDGCYLITANRQGTVNIWNLAQLCQE